MIFSTQDVQRYSEIVGALSASNVPFQTESVSGGGGEGGGYGFATTYHILVRPEDIRLANELVHHRR
ncbi:hypothetical protein NDK47_02455 [Brevibacillus ruminantium]|uniref:DUF2007 domain-containing protein n=1 Tax=Brevibacillus ruminantium TaxID=2950604 RepID=A0ABY4WGD5_9BACL|nr:hypothetical protein [Brevibacillus ruminantium]USG66216.1 hypothetical protein NDK47_02455 [Brevibacillus ruminantium]